MNKEAFNTWVNEEAWQLYPNDDNSNKLDRDRWGDGATALYNLLAEQMQEKDREIEKQIDLVQGGVRILNEAYKHIDYWKQRCEAAETVILFMDKPKNMSNDENYQFLVWQGKWSEWQQLKNNSSQERGEQK